MKITFLGTGTSQGIPTIGCSCEVCLSEDKRDKRLRCSILIEHKGTNILVDTTPDLRYQMLSNKVKRVDCVLFTHEHYDHTGGLDDLRPFNFIQGGEMPIFGQKRVIENIKNRFDYAFTGGRYPGAPRMQDHIVSEEEKFKFKDIVFQPIPFLHGTLPILGYRICDFAYLTDVKSIEVSSLERLKGLDVLVISGLRNEKHHSHLSIDEALAYIDKLNPRKAYITHISHKLGLHKEVTEKLPSNVELAHDGMIIDIDV